MPRPGSRPRSPCSCRSPGWSSSSRSSRRSPCGSTSPSAADGPVARRLPMFSTLRSLGRDPEGKVLLGSAITTVAVGTVVYMFLEGWSWLDALYFSVVTLATVGFGDLHPTTDEAKLFTIVYII